MAAPVAAVAGSTAGILALVALTGRQASDAFVLGLISAGSVAIVAGAVAFLRWLSRLDHKLDGLDNKIDDRVEEANARWREANLRLANLEKGYVETGEDSLRDSANRTEHRIAQISRRLGVEGKSHSGESDVIAAAVLDNRARIEALEAEAREQKDDQ